MIQEIVLIRDLFSVTGTMSLLIALLCFIALVLSHPMPQRLTEDQFKSFDFGEERGSKIYLQQPQQSNDHEMTTVKRKKRSLTPETVDEPPLALPVTLLDYLSSGSNLDPALTQQKRNKRNVDLRETSWKEGYVVGKSPQIIDYSPGTSGHMHHATWVSPRFNNEVFEKAGVHKVFFLILLLIVIGEFFR